MKLTSDLSKCKVGDWVCTAENGWGKVGNKDSELIAILSSGISCLYYYNGKYNSDSIYPTCFPIGQVPQPYLDIFGSPPCEFKDGDRVWVWEGTEAKHPCVFREYSTISIHPYCVYSSGGGRSYWQYCAQWNNGNPPEGDE